MGKGQNSSSNSQAQNVWASTLNAFQHNKTLWLAGALAFFVPSVAASAWYVGGAVGINAPESSVTSESASAGTNENNASSSSADGAHAQASANGVSAKAGSGGGSSVPQAEVSINGKKVEVPASGVVNQTSVNNDGSTSQVSVSVNANQGGSSNTNSFSSTSVNTNSSTNTNSNNTNSSTFFNSYTSSP